MSGDSNSSSIPKINAVIFDLDGTLVDNMDFHVQAFSTFTERHGLPDLTAVMRKRIDGKRNRDIFPILFDDPLDPVTIQAHTMEKESLYRNLSEGNLEPLDGLVEFLQFLEKNHTPFGIATSAPDANVIHSLEGLGLTEEFAVIVRGDQVPRGKPHPDVFLETAKLLDIPPAECLVFEDAPAGIEAALAAGMRCAAMTTSFDAETIMENVKPHYFLSSYIEVLNKPGRFGLLH